MSLPRYPSAWVGACVVALACSARPGPPAPAGTPSSLLPSGALALVGGMPVGEDRVVAVAATQGIGVRQALDREVRDAILANGALARGYDQSPAVRAAVRGRLSRAVLADVYLEAARAEPSDEEVTEATARHFVELDRPEAFRVIHAVVKVPEKANPALRERARALAERMSQAVAHASTEEEFRQGVESVSDRGDLEAVVESLKPVASDGRVVDLERPTGLVEQYALPFARAASRLSVPGQKSDVVLTEFGFHVLMLLEKIPSRSVPEHERRRTLRAEIVTERARRARAELLERLHAAAPAAVERSAPALLATVDLNAAGH